MLTFNSFSARITYFFKDPVKSGFKAATIAVKSAQVIESGKVSQNLRYFGLLLQLRVVLKNKLPNKYESNTTYYKTKL